MYWLIVTVIFAIGLWLYFNNPDNPKNTPEKQNNARMYRQYGVLLLIISVISAVCLYYTMGLPGQVKAAMPAGCDECRAYPECKVCDIYEARRRHLQPSSLADVAKFKNGCDICTNICNDALRLSGEHEPEKVPSIKRDCDKIARTAALANSELSRKQQQAKQRLIGTKVFEAQKLGRPEALRDVLPRVPKGKLNV